VAVVIVGLVTPLPVTRRYQRSAAPIRP
jgi:hypothetical protein